MWDSVFVDDEARLTPLGYVELKFDPLRIELSPNGVALLSWGASGSVNFNVWQLKTLPVVDRSKCLRKLIAAVRAGQDGGVVAAIVAAPDGRRTQLRVAFRISREGNRVTSWRALLIDDTETRRSEAEMRATLSTVPSAMIVIDAVGTIRAFSATASKMFGYKAEEVVGRSIEMLMDKRYRSAHSNAVKRYLETGEARVVGQQRSLDAVRSDGTEFPIEIWVGDASTESERLFTGFIRDQSERFETEARLQSLQNDLVHVSRLSALSELSLSLAHELNQPLAAIVNLLGTAEFVAERGGDMMQQQVQDIVKRASDEAMRAGAIVKKLRTFVERGEADMRLEPIGEIISGAVSLFGITLKRKRITLHIDIEDEAEQVLADRIQLQQVLFNLMRNSIEALEQFLDEGREISIKTHSLPSLGIEIQLDDNGPGISPEKIGDIFKPFASEKSTGMGVGLSISHRLVEAHGGTLSYQPRPGGGARFLLRLPLTDVPEAADV